MWRIRLWLWCGVASILASSGIAQVRFYSSELAAPGARMVWADVNGDSLQDALHIEDCNLIIHLQQAQKGFARQPDLRLVLDREPMILWTAPLGQQTESLLVMTAAGVTAWTLDNPGTSPTRQRIIEQVTTLPRNVPDSLVLHKPLSLRTDHRTSLILLPVDAGLQVWAKQESWQCVQTLPDVLRMGVSPNFKEMGYDRTVFLNMNIGDINGDDLEDLITCRYHQGEGLYQVYLQNDQGRLDLPPTLTYSSPWQEHTWMNWTDINHDGRVDLVRNTWLAEPWFIPGTRSGKVLVRVFLNAGSGEFPGEPSFVLRKNDWLPEVPVVDVDGDGFKDLVLGHSLFDSREGVRKTMTAKQLDFNLTIHCFDPNLGFTQIADCQRDLTMQLDKHSFHLTWSRRWAFERFVNLTGDFDGDGDIDILVRDHDKKISAYPFISRPQGFGRQAIVRFNYVEPVDWFMVRDLNGDGVSDLISQAKRRDSLKLFLSQKTP